MKKILGLLFIILLTSCRGQILTRDPSSLITHMGRSTVALMAADDIEEARPYCTGVWVGSNVILTANHCVEAAYFMKVEKEIDKLAPEEKKEEIYKWRHKTHEERQKLVVENTTIRYAASGDVDQIGKEPYAIRLGKVIIVDPEHDLAIVEAAGKNLPRHDIAYVAEENPAIGEQINIVGQPKGLYWTYISGTVAQYRESLPEERSLVTDVNEINVIGPYIQLSAPVWFGNSGGGAFDRDGNLVGIASFLTGAPHSSFFIHPDVIRKLLKDHKIQ